jgi:tetratricopeptide (TPR) repeat protein
MPKKFHYADKIAYILLSVTVFLGMIFFIPGGLISGEIFKGYLLVIGISSSFIAWLVARLLEGAMCFPSSRMLVGLLFLVVAVLFSGLFSQTSYLSFFGEAFEQGTAISILMLALAMFLTSELIVTRSRIFIISSGFFFLYTIVSIYQIIHLVLPGVTTLGAFFGNASSPIGAWSDFAYLSGAMLIASILVLEFLKQSKFFRVIAYIVGLISLFFVVLSNFVFVWMIVGFLAFVILFYKLMQNRKREEAIFPTKAFIVLIISLVMVLMNGLLGGQLANKFHIQYLSVAPSLSSTIYVAKSSIQSHPVFGAGPNRFLHEWLSYRPITANNNIMWSSPFSSGVSFFATLAMLTGVLGVVSVILFFLLFLIEGVKKTFSSSENGTRNFYSFSFFVIALYFLLATSVFSPGASIIICTFFFLGLYISTLTDDKRIGERTIYFAKDYKTSFFSVFFVVIMIVSMVAIVSVSTERFVSIVYFQISERDSNARAYVLADQRLAQAISISDSPTYERERVLLSEKILQNISSDSSLSPDTVSAETRSIVAIGNNSALRAVALDPTDPRNYLTYADFMRTMAGLKAQNAFSGAEDAYNSMIKLFPNYPESYLGLARLYVDSGDLKNAEKYVNQALAKKPNYTDAYFLAEKIDATNNDYASAIEKLKTAAMYDQNNPDIYFELGLVNYKTSDYGSALKAFQATLQLNQGNFSAWYYLALTHQKLGNTTDANSILELLHKRFPDSSDISNALSGPPASVPAPTSKNDKNKKPPLPPVNSKPKTQ